MKTIHPITRSTTSLACAVVLLTCGLNWTAKAGSEGSKIAPPNSQPYGESMAEWLKQYTAWLSVGPPAPQLFGHVLFPVVGGSATGSGTLTDPLIIAGHGDFTLKPGTALVTPLLGWTSEIYEDGSADPIPPGDWWGTYFALTGDLVLDGQTVITEKGIEEYYVSTQYYIPAFTYPEPTSYGSVALKAVEGWVVLCKPLAVGVHQLNWESSVMLPADNGLFPFELGEILRLSYTVTVAP